MNLRCEVENRPAQDISVQLAITGTRLERLNVIRTKKTKSIQEFEELLLAA